MSNKLIIQTVIAAVAFIMIGIAMSFAPTILTGFESLRTDPSVGNYTALNTVILFGPTMIILGFIISIAIVGFMGIKAVGTGS